ncbi:hypothetical protein AX17_004287 [Amanita inopinata Kibby_2008]|nr:hypothetical protein AX17_004287 [Amanita inopinata Kibby_2008]
MLDLPTKVGEARRATMRRVEDTIKAEYGRHYCVRLFGSSSYGVSSALSDLDLVIVDPLRPRGFVSTDSCVLPSIYNLRPLARVLKRAGYKNVMAIPSAVPIVKFMDPRTRLQCDINVNDRLGLRNTQLLKQYMKLFPLLRPMLAVIKSWAKPLGLNSPMEPGVTASFSSYAFGLMTIGFLQMRKLLPNLQAHLPPVKETDSEFVWSRKPAIACDVRFHRTRYYRVSSEVKLGDLMREWFRYWGFEHHFASQTLSIRHGGMILRSPECINTSGLASIDAAALSATKEVGLSADEINEQWSRHLVCVIDPFIRTKNVTASIGKRCLSQFQASCREVCEKGDFDQLNGCDVGIGDSLRTGVKHI